MNSQLEIAKRKKIMHHEQDLADTASTVEN